MNTVILLENFRIAIPSSVCKALQVVPGDKLRLIQYAGRLELLPVRPVEEMRGFLGGMNTLIEREEEE